jgi:hypothetical protein
MAIRECKTCKSYQSGTCSKKKLNVSINATWCKDYELDAIIGELITGDLEESTMLFKIEGEMILKAGRYAIVPIEEYNNLIN